MFSGWGSTAERSPCLKREGYRLGVISKFVVIIQSDIGYGAFLFGTDAHTYRQTDRGYDQRLGESR